MYVVVVVSDIKIVVICVGGVLDIVVIVGVGKGCGGVYSVGIV